MTPVSVNRGAMGCYWAWQAGRKEGSRSRRHHGPPLPPLGSPGALGTGSVKTCLGNKFFLICFLQLSWK